MATRTFFVNGDTGVAVIVNSNANAAAISAYPYTSSYPYTSDTYFNTSFPYLQLKGKAVISTVTFPQVDPEYIRWNEGGCDCFSANTLISMADGTNKKISEVHVGEQVLSISGIPNTVTFIEKVPDSVWGYLYSPDLTHKPFITINHPIYIQGKLSGVNAESIQNMYPWLGPIQELKNFNVEPARGELVYNLWTTGDGTYTANGYGTHSIMNTGDFLNFAFKNTWLTQAEVCDLLIYFTNKGNRVQYGAYLINKALMYVKPRILLKIIARNLAKENSLTKIAVVRLGELLGKLLHPNKGVK